jgi:S1-C subfamily serine protease
MQRTFPAGRCAEGPPAASGCERRADCTIHLARGRRCIRLAAAVVVLLGACAPSPQGGSAFSQVPDAQPSAAPGHYDYTGLKTVKIDGVDMTPAAALEKVNQHYSVLLAQIPPDGHPMGKTVRIVLPDHDRLRPLILQRFKTAQPGTIEFMAERERLDEHFLADVLQRSGLFRSVSVAEENDTVAPDAGAADYLIWLQVRSLSPNNVGPWAAGWRMKTANGRQVVPIGLDTGTPSGVARLESFVKSVRIATLELGGNMVAAMPGIRPQGRRSGSGIVVDSQGHILTNNHVVASCSQLRVLDTSNQSNDATLVAADAANDLAVLHTDRHWPAWARFRDSGALRPGESLVATGFPLTGLLSPEMAVTTGSLTTLAGQRGDSRQFEFSAPVQPGNSGGPVMDDTGHVVGVTVAVLNGLVVAAATGGALPQNVNFAIKSTTAREFLESNGIHMDESGSRQAITAPDIGATARRFTVRIECQP